MSQKPKAEEKQQVRDRGTNNCIVCVLRPMLVAGSIVGIPSLSFSCPHTASPSVHGEFVHSKIRAFLSYIVLVLVLLNIIYDSYILYENPMPELEVIIFIPEMIFSAGAVTMLAVVNAKKHKLIAALSSLAAIAQNYTNYGCDHVLDDGATKFMQNLSKILLGSLLGCEFGYIAGCVFGFIHFKYGYVPFRVGANFLCLYTCIVTAFFLMFGCCLYYLLFRNCCRQIRSVFRYNLTVPDLKYNRKGAHGGNPGANFETMIKKITRLYRDLYFNYQEFNDCIGVAVVAWIVIYVVMIISGIYLIFIMVSNFKNLDGFLLILLYTCLSGNIVLLVIWERISNTAEDLMSFLFRYPLSKLSTSEATQVEMLMTTLKLQRPIFRASNMFTVGTRLMASIAGTVVTYVIVALQFHGTWAE